MTVSENELRVLDCRPGDHDYLHRDFHGALCFSIRYLDERFGPQATEQYLREVGQNTYRGLVSALKAEGLDAMERHWREVFTKEEGSFRIHREGGALVLVVEECPAISHLKRTGQLFTDRYCETTVVVNRTVCGKAGFESSCVYEPGQGRCVQKFWNAGEAK
jgi:hypothetical protein